MRRALFACGEAKLPKDTSQFDVAEELDWRGARPSLEIEGIEQKLIEAFSPAARDLLELACCVYAADRLVSRGENNLTGKDWRRSIRLRMPVREVARWKALEPQLSKMLGFLTEDEWHFDFLPAKRTTVRPTSLYDDPTLRACDCVALFSGGLDSFAGALDDQKRNGHRPLLVSHRSHSVVDNRQRDLVSRLNAPSRLYEHVQFWVHLRDRSDRETSQRSRSFLFLAVAVVIAQHLSIKLVHVFENGILSINLPLAPQVVGTMASRTTHPRYLAEMQALAAALFTGAPAIELPFMLRTKREIIDLLKATGDEAFITSTSSCAHPYWRSRLSQHCGVCSQCIDRRFAVEAAGLGDLDKTYEHDLFTGAISAMPHEAEARSLIEGYLRTYREVAELNEEAFWIRFPELTRLSLYLARSELGEVYQLYQRQWRDIEGVLNAQVRQYTSELVLGKLPSDCVLQVIMSQALNRKSQRRYADRIVEIATRTLRTAYSGIRPKDEPEIQRQIAAGLAAAGEPLEREHPLFLFVTGVKAKPDFAEGKRRVWVEVKYPRRDSVTVRDVTEQIASDVMKYRGQAELVLFLIYDPDSLIPNRDLFSSEIEEREPQCLVRVI